MSDHLFQMMMALIPVFFAIVTRFIIPFLQAQVSAAKLEEITKWITKAVQAAELLFQTPRSGEEKREYVIRFIDKMFNSRKEVITEEQIRILLEAALKQMKQA